MIAPQALTQAEVSPKPPKQTKLLGATVAGVGLVTTVSAELFECFALVERPDGTETHVFVADLGRDNVTFPAEPQPFVKMTRRLGYGLYGSCYQLETVKFSDLTHVDEQELRAA